MIVAEIRHGEESRIAFPTTLAGVLVTGYTWGVTSTVVRSLDGGAFSAVTNTPAEIASSSGVHHILLTAAECTVSHFLAVKLTDSGLAFDPIVLIATPSFGAFSARLHQVVAALEL